MRFISFLLGFCLLASAARAHEISGKIEVLLKGDKKKKDLSSVVVYLSRPGAAPNIPPELLRRKYTIETRNKQFIPHALPVPVGASVDFPNYDPIFHNLFSVSAPNAFDLGLYKGGASKSKSFAHPGIVKVFCNVHPQMAATIIVSDTPHITTADSDGNFRFGYVTPGLYDLIAYTDEGQARERLTVGEKPLRIEVQIDGRKFKRVRHKNKFGKDYETDEKY